MEDANLLGKIAKKWKNDKKTAFLKGTALVSMIGGILCVIAYNVNGSYIDKDGFLVESFGFIPLGFLFAFIALVSVIILAFIAIIRRYKRR